MKQLATVIGWVLMGAGAVVAQRVTYSTHDWSGLNGIQPDCWADVVTPGSAQGQSGITYSVGTTIIGGAPLSTFSGDGVMAPAGLFGFTGSKQVVVLQKSDPSELDGIEWQAYFFGRELASVGGVGQSATARAISVWPAATEADTRIAICGSSFDPILPSSGSAPPDRAAQWSSASPPAGFIAVYDGGGVLLWSYPFFGRDAFSATTITDVSVRYDPVTDTDIVTYCGASTNGNYLDPSQSGQTTMAPLFPHLAPTPNFVGVTDIYATGNVHHAPLRSQSTGQWDGIVGRVHAPHQQVPMVQTPVMRDFHSIVGGPGDDVLLGISEINETEFVTVGATQGQSSPGPHFPLTNPRWAGSVFNMNQLAQWEMGVILRFEYFPPALLNLSTSTVIGAPSSSTIAKDVIWHGGVAVAVGTTSDAVFASGLTGGFQTSFAGSATGFVVASDDLDNGFSFGSFLGAAAVGSGATGVAAWNEYPDHVAISGWTRSAAGSDSRIALYSLFRESGVYSLIRDYIIDDAPTSPANQRVDRPGARFAGIQSALSSSPAFFVQADSTESGGLAVDERGQISVVGNVWFSAPTPNATYPVQGGAIARISDGLSFQNVDAVRTTVDMLPSGVARTDGTGDLVGVNWTMVSGDGGTTPICATEPFGNVLQVPQVERMFVDFDGQAQAGAVASVLVDRPPLIPGGVISVGALQVGLPPQSPSINPLFPGIELWLNGSTVITLPMVSNGESIREPL